MSTPSASASARVARLVARVGVEVLAVAELRRVDEQRDDDHVALARARARISDRWPSWKKPIVGTSPIVRPPRRSGASAARSSATVRTVFIAGDPVRREARGSRSTSASNSGEQLRGGVGDRVALALDGRLVAARDRAGERALGPERDPVLDGRAHERGEQLARLARARARRRGHLLRRRLDRHQEVGGDRGRGVVGGALVVGELERVACRGARASRVGGGERARRRARRWHSRTPAKRAAAGGEGLERVEAERVGAAARRLERGQRRGAARVADERRAPGGDGRGRRRSRRRARRAGRRRPAGGAAAAERARRPRSRRRAARARAPCRGGLGRRAAIRRGRRAGVVAAWSRSSSRMRRYRSVSEVVRIESAPRG